jgi:hypothetical protein
MVPFLVKKCQVEMWNQWRLQWAARLLPSTVPLLEKMKVWVKMRQKSSQREAPPLEKMEVSRWAPRWKVSWMEMTHQEVFADLQSLLEDPCYQVRRTSFLNRN